MKWLLRMIAAITSKPQNVVPIYPKLGTVALCVGHSRLIRGRLDGGAVSVDGTSEHAYNDELADMIGAILLQNGVDVIVYAHYEGNGYTTAMSWLAQQVKRDGADLAVELHFNSANGQATGHEWLYWYSSDKGMEAAFAMDSELMKRIPSLRQRGIKKIHAGERGAVFLRRMPCPAVIAEPFFGDNRSDWLMATTRKQDIAEAIAAGIIDALS